MEKRKANIFLMDSSPTQYLSPPFPHKRSSEIQTTMDKYYSKHVKKTHVSLAALTATEATRIFLSFFFQITMEVFLQGHDSK
jgi:hypothetical protein